MSCSCYQYSKDDLVGVYVGKSIPQYSERIDWSYESIMAYLKGDSSNYSLSYIVYNELPPFSLELGKDNTFSIGAVEFLFGKGQWEIIGKDLLILSFNPLPKDTAYYGDVALGPMQYEGIRKLKIINKNKLQYEYTPYYSTNDSIIKIFFKRH